MRDVDAGHLRDRRHRKRRSAVGIGGIDLGGTVAFDIDLGVARDGHERDLLVARVDTRKDDRVGAIEVVGRTVFVAGDRTVGAHEQDVEGIGGAIGGGKGARQIGIEALLEVVVDRIGHVLIVRVGSARTGKQNRGDHQQGDDNVLAALARALAMVAVAGDVARVIVRISGSWHMGPFSRKRRSNIF